jgi:GGDEF domain-containing protein
MPHTGSAEAREVAERIRLAIADLAEPLTKARRPLNAADATRQDAERRSTTQRADVALYQAKRAGANPRLIESVVLRVRAQHTRPRMSSIC